ncbi:UDP-galactose transporter senju-like [Dendronephthya gigantea]|uniref:UDP-galactose transporter senju-like n=1 Tax=Dendronephthya gigantea TaxID=151771 RepID=UPI00106C8C47|nr:UDP-galactose transporter senju-like [Dendronephthya gigantea]
MIFYRKLRIFLLASMSDSSNKLFPTRLHLVIFITYIALFVNQGLLITASKDENNKYTYNTTTVVILVELGKLFFILLLQFRESSLSEFLNQIKSNARMFGFYMIPALLYCLYNNLAFINLKAYGPTSYWLLLQFRVVTTGVVYQFLFNKQLSLRQWLSLGLLTFGCIVQHIGHSSAESSSFNFRVDRYLLFMLVQIFSSCIAGVYNEYLLKGKAGDVPFLTQSFFMYLDSIICNFGYMYFNSTFSQALTPEGLASLKQPIVLGIILNNTIAGLVTAILLKKLNSILKQFGASLEIIFTAILVWILFGKAITTYTFMAIVIVCTAIYIYSTSPIQNPSTQGNTVEATGQDSSRKGEHV